MHLLSRSALILLCLLACGRPVQLGAAPLRLGMFPSYAPDEIQRRITPLAAMLAAKLAVAVEAQIVPDFAAYEKRLREGSLDISYANPVVAIQHARELEPLLIMNRGEQGSQFHGLIISRADTPLQELADLRGKRVCIMGRSSSYGYLSQKLTLLDAGLDAERELRLQEAVGNKLENVIFSVYLGEADAGFISEIGLHQIDRYVPAALIRVLATTAPLPGWVLSVRRDLDGALKEKALLALLALPKDDPVLQALRISGFRRVTPRDFDRLRQAMELPPVEGF